MIDLLLTRGQFAGGKKENIPDNVLRKNFREEAKAIQNDWLLPLKE